MIQLSPRLQMVAGLVRGNQVLTDIGTDHAYLPAYLLQIGKIPSAIAADVRQGPLGNARETVEKYGLEDKITLVLSDGFSNLHPEDSKEFVLAGMGGNLMEDLLAAAPWLQAEGIHLVLQPQSHQEDLRNYLYRNGFSILQEQLCKEGSRLYLAMDAEYTGTPSDASPLACYLGTLADSDHPLKAEYFQKVLDRLGKRLNGLLTMDHTEEECNFLLSLMNAIKERTGV